MRIPSGTTDQYIYFVAVDSTDYVTRETGLSSFTVYRSRDGGTAAAMTTPTINETDSSNMPGVYELLLDEDMTIGSGNDTEEVVYHITHAGMAPVTRTIELYRPKMTVGETLTVTSSALGANTVTATSIASNAITAAKIATDAITAAKIAANAIGASELAADAVAEIWAASTAPTAAAIRSEIDSNSTQLAAIVADTNELQTDDVPSLIAALNNLSAAQVNAEVDTAISDAGLDNLAALVMTAGTAQAGSDSSITLAAGAESTLNSAYVGAFIVLTGGTGAPQVRRIDAYTASTRVASIDNEWQTNPSSDTTYVVFGAQYSTYVRSWGSPTSTVASLAAGNRVSVDVTAISGDSAAADNLEAAFDGTGYDLGGIDVSELNTAVDAIGTDGTGLTEAGGTGDQLTAVTSAISGLNDLSAAEVNAEVDAALSDIHLDHLLAATYDPASKPGAADALLNELIENDGGVSRFTANALEQGPSGGGSASPFLLQSTTIATLASQTSFTLTAGSADDDAYINAIVVVTDQSTSTQKAFGYVSDYVGSTRTVTLASDPGIFTMAVGDSIDVVAFHPLIANLDAAITSRSSHSAANVRTEIDSNSTQLAAILADTDELQSDDIPALIAALNDPTVGAIADAVWDEVMSGHSTAGTTGAEIQSHLTAAELASALSLTAPMKLVGTTINVVNSQTNFTLSNGPDYDDILNGMMAIIVDVVDSDNKFAVEITDYVGGTRTVTIASAPPFTIVGSGADAITVWGTLDSGATAAEIRAEIDSNSTQLAAIVADTNELQTNQGDWATATGFSTHSAADVRTEMDSNSTQLAAIVADTNELQTDDIPGAIAALNDLSTSDIDARLAAIGLDHLLSASVTGTDVADDSIFAQLVSASGTADWDDFDNTTDSLEALQAEHDATQVDIGAISAGSNPTLLQTTTIATLASQTSFTLTAGSADDDAYNNQIIIVVDQSTSTQKAVGIIQDYVGSTRTVTLDSDPGIFTMAVGDTVYVVATSPAASAPSAAAIRAEIDSNSTQLAAIVADTNELQTNQGNWLTATGFSTHTPANVRTEMDANSTQLAAIVADTNELQTDDIPGAISALNNLSTSDIDARLAAYDAPTRAELTSDIGTVTSAIASLNNLSAAQVNAEVDSALADYDAPTRAELTTDIGTVTSAIAGLNDPSAGAIADAVWDEAKAGHVSAGSFGEEVQAHALSSEISALSIPTAAQIRAEIDSNSTQLAAILADTNELQTDDVPGLIAALNNIAATDIVSGGAITTSGGAVSTVTAVTNQVTANMTSVSGSSTAADNLELSALSIITGTAQTGTLSTTQMSSNLAEGTDDHYIGRVIIWTSGNLVGQASDITDYAGTNGVLTFTAVTEAPSNGDTFIIV